MFWKPAPLGALPSKSKWIFPAPRLSGHIEKSTPKKQHKRAYTLGVRKGDEFNMESKDGKIYPGTARKPNTFAVLDLRAGWR